MSGYDDLTVKENSIDKIISDSQLFIEFYDVCNNMKIEIKKQFGQDNR